ncbi:MAG: 3'-5' exonuclease [Saprospiraceae bacterium]
MSQFDHFDLYNILFLDVETASAEADFEDLSTEMQELWKRKHLSILRLPSDHEPEFDELAFTYKERAGIFAEYGKIICISVGFMTRGANGEPPVMRLKSYAHHNEIKLLEEFGDMLNRHFNQPEKFALCGHNIREFDVPYICRRMLVNQIPLPKLLDIGGKKPWETKHLIDTLEMWKFGDVKNYTSLRLLAALFGIPSPKDDIDGSDVGRIYWEERDLDRIAKYCEKDVLATAQLYLRMRRLPLLEPEQVVIVGG